MNIIDTAARGNVKKTKEGYLVAEAKIARTGVQHYLASELGDTAIKAGFAPNDVVRVYRHADEVFSADSLRTTTRVPVTVNHPPVSVNSTNWADLAVGEVGDAVRIDGDWIIVNPMVKDSSAIMAAETTHKEISMGYDAEIVKARDGIDADFEMKNIRMNHLALVTKGRAGSEARIGDSWGAEPIIDTGNAPTTKSKMEDKNMSDALKTVVLGDAAVQVSATDVAAIEKFKADTNQKMADAEASHKSAIEAKDEEIGSLKAELKEAKDAAVIDVDALVAARTDLVGKIKALDSSIDAAGKTDAELRKMAVASKLGDEMVADASESEISGMFKALTKTVADSNPVKSIVTDDDKLNDSQAGYVARLTRKAK